MIFALSTEDYEKLSSPRVSDDLQKIRDKIKEPNAQVELVLKELDPFSFEESTKEFILNNPLFCVRKVKNKTDESQTSFDFGFTPYFERFPIFKENHSRPGSISSVFLATLKNFFRKTEPDLL